MRELSRFAATVPLGLFLAWHLFVYAKRAAAGPAPSPANPDPWWALAASALLVWIPLAFHGAVALWSTWTEEPPHENTPARDVGRVLHHLAALGVLVFLVHHLWTMRWPLLTGERYRADIPAELYATLSSTVALGIPAVALVYIAGVLCSTFHFTYGLFRSCHAWGIVRSAGAKRRLLVACAVLGAGLLIMGVGAVIHFATGSRPFGV